MNRRRFVELLFLLLGFSCSTRDEVPGLATQNCQKALIAESELWINSNNIKQIGKIYYDQIPQKDKSLIRSRVEAYQVYVESTFVEKVSLGVKKDFESLNTIKVLNWELSETECQLCAYYYLYA